MNHTRTEIKNTLERIKSRITGAEEQINELEDKMVEITATEQNKEKRMNINEDSLRNFWDIKYTNIWIRRKLEESTFESEEGGKKVLRKYLKRF